MALSGCGGRAASAFRVLEQTRRVFFTASSSRYQYSRYHHQQNLLRHLRAYNGTRSLLTKFKESSPNSVSSSHFAASVGSSAGVVASHSTRKGFVNWYLGMIEDRPVLTKALTAGLIFTFADLSSQIVSSGSVETLDLVRMVRMASYGMLISGPSLHLWFNFLSRILPKRDLLTTFKKMFLGQTTYGPFIMIVFFSYNAALQGESSKEILARLKRDVLPALINGLIYWPTCDFITFKFTPVRLQPLVSNSFSFLWTIYLTYVASLAKAEPIKVSAG